MPNALDLKKAQTGLVSSRTVGSYKPTTSGNIYSSGSTSASDLQARLAAARKKQNENTATAQNTAAAAGVELPSNMRTGDSAWFNWEAAGRPTAAGSRYTNPTPTQSPTPTNNGTSGYYSGGSGGGGGGGAAAPLPDFNQFAQIYKGVLGEDVANPYAGMANPYSGMENPYANVANPYEGIANPYTGQEFAFTKMIDPAVDADIANARKAFAGVADGVSMENPYLALLAQQQVQTDPRLAAFAESQGVGQEQQQMADRISADVASGQSNWSNLASVLGTNHLAGQQNIIDTSKLQGEHTVQSLEAQRLAMEAFAAGKQQDMDTRALDVDLQLALQAAGFGGQLGMAGAGWTGQQGMAEAGFAGQLGMSEAEFEAAQSAEQQAGRLRLLEQMAAMGATDFSGAK